MKARLRLAVETTLPAKATVLVVSKGDDDLLDLNGRSGQHFPQAADASYSGFNPADDKEAIDHLESLRRRGAEFLLIPESASWWLDHYQAFHRHLIERYPLALSEDGVGTVFSLDEAVALESQPESQCCPEG
jgi:hypothetical protein